MYTPVKMVMHILMENNIQSESIQKFFSQIGRSNNTGGKVQVIAHVTL